jgi:hypothetical protein
MTKTAVTLYHGTKLNHAIKQFNKDLMAAGLITFNPDELSTWTEVVKFRNILNNTRDSNGFLVGGGVKVLTNDPLTSGGYLPSWAVGPGNPEPQIGNSKWYHFRFNNGFEGVNVGLVRGMFGRYPTSPLYVVGQLRKEIG